MKPTEEDLILRVNPVLAHLSILAFMGLTLLIFLFAITTSYSTTLTCEKFTSKSEVISCQILNTSFLGIKKEQTILFSDSPQAAIVEKKDSSTNQPSYQAILATNAKKIVIVRNPGNYHYNEWQENTVQLNKFIKNNNKQKITIKDKYTDVVFASFILASFFAFVSVAIWTMKTNITCVMSRKSGNLSIERGTLFGKQTYNYSLQDIEKVLLETSDGIDTTTSRITFKFKAGNLISLTSYYDSFSGKQEAVQYLRGRQASQKEDWSREIALMPLR